MKCPKCNEEIEDNAKFCTKCGANILEEKSKKAEIERKKQKEIEDKKRLEEIRKEEERKREEAIKEADQRTRRRCSGQDPGAGAAACVPGKPAKRSE